MTDRPAMRLACTLAAALSIAACNGPAPGPPLPQADLGPSLGAGHGDPILLTFAAARARSRYLGDQGYTLAWDADDVPAFTTASAGDLGVVFEIDGVLYASEDDLASPITIAHTASDSVVLTFAIDFQLQVEVWFVAGSSSAATLDVRLTSIAPYPRHASIIPWLRRCDGPFTGVAAAGNGLAAQHTVVPDPLLVDAGSGTFLTDFADALAGDQAPVVTLGAASCGPSAENDVEVMIDDASPPPATAPLIALRLDADIPPASSVEIRAHRALVDAAEPDTLPAAVAAEQALPLIDVLQAGNLRLAAAPPPAGLSPANALAYRSSLALVDQATMPAEGLLAHDYYVFAREPPFWFARLGQDVHESLAMILLAHLDPAEAAATQRNFIDHVQADGYLPFRIGPVIDAPPGRVAAAPLFSFESWEIAKLAQDPAFLADAYAAGKLLHGFWVTQRDQDHDGLSEWGSAAESLRDPDNVISAEVAPPTEVEAVDLNSMLVMEETSLAAMATALSLPAEAAAWESAAAARAALINAEMWDEGTGFYYDISLATHSFTYQTPGDLKRMEIAGFLPLWAGIVGPAQRPALLAHLADPSMFLRTYGVASLAAQDPFYGPGATACCEWNGPVFVPWQWLVVRGLRAYGETALAEEITLATLAGVRMELQRSHQFRELYDPDDAVPLNGSMPNYVWSAMGALMVLEGGS
jgi:Trehalase